MATIMIHHMKNISTAYPAVQPAGVAIACMLPGMADAMPADMPMPAPASTPAQLSATTTNNAPIETLRSRLRTLSTGLIPLLTFMRHLPA